MNLNAPIVFSTEKSPTVSIVVISYNQGEFIDECLESCVSQAHTISGIEVVVADDGSQDETPQRILEWAAKFPSLVRPVLAEKNCGIAANLNRGLSAARGEFIAWFGGDDVMLAGKIKCQVDFLMRHPQASGCYHDAEVFSWPSGEVQGLFSELYAGRAAKVHHVDLKRMLDPRYQMLPSTVMVRRQCIPGSFDTRLRFHNDYLFDFEAIAKRGPYLRLDGVLTRYRKHDKSIGRDLITRALMLEENLMVMAILEARFPHLAAKINRRSIYYLSLEALKCRRDGDVRKSFSLCLAIWSRGGLVRALCIVLFGGLLSSLANPKYRKIAVKLRSVIG